MQLLTLAGNARNHTTQGEESLAALEREAERLRAEIGQARNEQETLGIESGQAHLRFESAAGALERLETEIAAFREIAASQARGRKAPSARSPTSCAASKPPLPAAATPLESLIRNHSYSTDSCASCSSPALSETAAPGRPRWLIFLKSAAAHESRGRRVLARN